MVLLDSGDPGAQASGAAAGMLAPCSEAAAADAFLDFARASLAEWPSFAARALADSGVDPELSVCGLLRVALDDAAAAEVQSRLRWQASAGVGDGRWVSAAEACELEPALSGDVRGAAWYASEGHVDARQAVRALVAAARTRGATVRCGASVAGPSATGAGVRLQDGSEIHAGRVVLAAGAWLGDLAAAFGAALPVRPVFGQIAVLHGVAAPPRRVVYAGLHGYVVAKGDGTLLAGATAIERGFDTTPDPSTTAALHAQASRLVPAASTAISIEPRTGLRPCAPDKLPLLGPLPGRDDGAVLVAGAHYRNGVLLAPATARGMAAMLLDGVTPPGWEAFDPRRFG